MTEAQAARLKSLAEETFELGEVVVGEDAELHVSAPDGVEQGGVREFVGVLFEVMQRAWMVDTLRVDLEANSVGVPHPAPGWPGPLLHNGLVPRPHRYPRHQAARR